MKTPGITAKLRTRQFKPGDQSINKSTFILSGYINSKYTLILKYYSNCMLKQCDLINSLSQEFHIIKLKNINLRV